VHVHPVRHGLRKLKFAADDAGYKRWHHLIQGEGE
jgi:hypothetical protein